MSVNNSPVLFNTIWYLHNWWLDTAERVRGWYRFSGFVFDLISIQQALPMKIMKNVSHNEIASVYGSDEGDENCCFILFFTL